MSPYPVFDDVIHEPHRLRICALLVPSTGTEFGSVRESAKNGSFAIYTGLAIKLGG